MPHCVCWWAKMDHSTYILSYLLSNSCSISQPACGTHQKFTTKCYDWGDAPQCKSMGQNGSFNLLTSKFILVSSSWQCRIFSTTLGSSCPASSSSSSRTQARWPGQSHSVTASVVVDVLQVSLAFIDSAEFPSGMDVDRWVVGLSVSGVLALLARDKLINPSVFRPFAISCFLFCRGCV